MKKSEKTASFCTLEHITKNYKMGETVTPLKDINLEVAPGDFICIEGPSGTGKSTLLYVIGTLLESDEGKLIIDGKDTAEMSDAEKTELRAEKIGFLFQDSNMIQSLTLRENLEFVRDISGKDKKSESVTADIDELLDEFGLKDRADFFPHQLSGGQRRRAMAARALIHRPKLILADEPTNDLDDKWAAAAVERLREECAKGAAVIMVTHNDKWTGNATRRYRLDEGALKEI